MVVFTRPTVMSPVRRTNRRGSPPLNGSHSRHRAFCHRPTSRSRRRENCSIRRVLERQCRRQGTHILRASVPTHRSVRSRRNKDSPSTSVTMSTDRFRSVHFQQRDPRSASSRPSLGSGRRRSCPRTGTRKTGRRSRRLNGISPTRYLQDRSTNSRPRGTRRPMSSVRRRQTRNGNSSVHYVTSVSSSNSVCRARGQCHSVKCCQQCHWLRCSFVRLFRYLDSGCWVLCFTTYSSV